MKQYIQFLLFPLILPAIFIAAVALGALVVLFLTPLWWTQCQVFNLLFHGTSTWTCF